MTAAALSLAGTSGEGEGIGPVTGSPCDLQNLRQAGLEYTPGGHKANAVLAGIASRT